MVERLEATLSQMERLERFKGHFFNWYDTQDLRALDPQVLSSVDSGNLAAHLITLANACRSCAGSCRLSPSDRPASTDGAGLWHASARRDHDDAAPGYIAGGAARAGA